MQYQLGSWMRFGGLSPVKQRQRGKESDATFHSPPRRRGVYAYVDGFVDTFLIGDTSELGHISNKIFRLLDEAENPMVWDDHMQFDLAQNRSVPCTKKCLSLLRRKGIQQKQLVPGGENGAFICVLRKPRRFSYTGPVWHHLTNHVKEEEIEQRWGSWVLTSFPAWASAVRKAIHADRRELHSDDLLDESESSLQDGTSWHILKNAGALGSNPYKTRLTAQVDLDHLEVFIERPH